MSSGYALGASPWRVLKALQDENAKLKELSKDFRDLVQTLNAIRELGLQPSLRQIYFLPGKSASIPTTTSLDLCYGRYELDGDTLRVSLLSAYSIPKTISDKGQVLWVLKRKQP